ncbi:hypothetical protein GCM10009304_12530 [Pseudomonas matsuisoli]|uniref:Uncharacterized protein n=1 Tax=Pseudomonas matsuisoli TaxID=1515666 RepID=A0A917UVG1_9PSED|nr:hypothetical protein GCM10009304_12530 [Pseudomonas matsuisoli]
MLHMKTPALGPAFSFPLEQGHLSEESMPLSLSTLDIGLLTELLPECQEILLADT